MRRIVVGMILLVLAVFAYAVPVDITHGTVAVADQSEASLNKGIQKAFQQVLIKASGNTAINSLPAIQQAEQTVQSYVLSYHLMAGGAGETHPPLFF